MIWCIYSVCHIQVSEGGEWLPGPSPTFCITFFHTHSFTYFTSLKKSLIYIPNLQSILVVEWHVISDLFPMFTSIFCLSVYTHCLLIILHTILSSADLCPKYFPFSSPFFTFHNPICHPTFQLIFQGIFYWIWLLHDLNQYTLFPSLFSCSSCSSMSEGHIIDPSMSVCLPVSHIFPRNKATCITWGHCWNTLLCNNGNRCHCWDKLLQQ
jgi:hypothetical protein